MARIYIDRETQEEITEIAWVDQDGNDEAIVLNPSVADDVVFLKLASGKQSPIYLKDIDKLITALQKAKELGWDKQ